MEGDPKAPFSLATTPRCRRGRNSIPWIAPLYTWSLQCWVLTEAASSTIYWVFGMIRPGIEARSRGPLTNTQLIRSMAWFIIIIIIIIIIVNVI